MKFLVCEGKADGTYNASTKARDDAEKILKSCGYEKLYINTNRGIQTNKLMKWKQLYDYKHNKRIWEKAVGKMKSGDIVVFQYPLNNTVLNFEQVIQNAVKKGVNIIALIHDLDSLRYKPEVQGKMLCHRILKQDKEILKECKYIIAHNDSMKKQLIMMGNDEDKIISLKLFDYLYDSDVCYLDHQKNEPVIIAGNLSVEKAKYLCELKNINGVDFNLYGVGFSDNNIGNNVHYKGKFLPEELIEHLQGSFGLIWDGEKAGTIKGGFGEYLRYNNPHKASLYLSAGIPIIVWKESALSKFVEENNVGISINNIYNLKAEIDKISDEQYDRMIKNARNVSQKEIDGGFLKDAIEKVALLGEE